MRENLVLQPQHTESGLQASFAAFMLSREAMRCAPKTPERCRYTTGGFAPWLAEAGIRAPEDIGRLDAILLTGGQALALGRYLPEMMNGTGDLLVISDDPLFDNARGFLRLLRYQMRRRDR